MLIVMGWATIFTYEAVRQLILTDPELSPDRQMINAELGIKQRKISKDYEYEGEDDTDSEKKKENMKLSEENIRGLQLIPEEQSEEGDFHRISEYLSKNSHECRDTTRPQRVNPLVYGKWHHHKTDLHHIYMYSAFFDERQDNGYYPSIRVLAVGETIKEDIYCQVWYPDMKNPVVKKVKIKKNGGGHELNGTWYEQYYFVCHLDTSYPIPRHVSIVSRPCEKAFNSVPIYLPIRAPRQHEFGVCVPVSFWSVDPHRLVEWIEANRILGVTEINVYHVNMSQETLGILRHFEVNDTIMRLHELPSVPKYERTRGGNKIGSPISLNDCMYRNTYRYRWTIVIDFDEIIVPRVQNNYSAMIDHILTKEKLTKKPPASLSFRNSYFWTGCGTQKDQPKNSLMLRHLVREPPNRFLYATKSIIDPRRCISVFNHYCYHRFPMRSEKEQWTIDVSQTIALSHHYRENYKNKKCKHFKKEAVKDEIMLKFKDTLATNVKKQMKRLGL